MNIFKHNQVMMCAIALGSGEVFELVRNYTDSKIQTDLTKNVVFNLRDI